MYDRIHVIRKSKEKTNTIEFTAIFSHEGTKGIESIIANRKLEITKWMVHGTTSRRISIGVRGGNSEEIDEFIKALLEKKNRKKHNYELEDRRSSIL